MAGNYYFMRLLKKKFIYLKIIPINLLEIQKTWTFVLEEGFSKELLERQSRKDGPIIGIEEI